MVPRCHSRGREPRERLKLNRWVLSFAQTSGAPPGGRVRHGQAAAPGSGPTADLQKHGAQESAADPRRSGRDRQPEVGLRGPAVQQPRVDSPGWSASSLYPFAVVSDDVDHQGALYRPKGCDLMPYDETSM